MGCFRLYIRFENQCATNTLRFSHLLKPCNSSFKLTLFYYGEVGFIEDIKIDFPSVDYVGNLHYVFNIKGNKYRVVVVVNFRMGYVFIRFTGTHAEYDRINCATIKGA